MSNGKYKKFISLHISELQTFTYQNLLFLNKDIVYIKPFLLTTRKYSRLCKNTLMYFKL